MSISVRVLVGLVFLAVGASFVVTTVVLREEFYDTNWLTFAVFESQHFLFFPTFGIIALITFYIPACVVVDIFLKHVRFGWLQLIVGILVLLAVSYFISAQIVQGRVPNMWQIKPEVLKADTGAVIEGCDPKQQTCRNAPVLDALIALRHESQNRIGLSKFIRNCNPDPLLEKPSELDEKRFCFVTKTLMNAEQCCQAQKVFTTTLAKMYENPENRSRTEVANLHLLPYKTFFLLIMLNIGVLLAAWRKTVDDRYPGYITYIERGLMFGAVAMLIWPLANHGFLQSRQVLYGVFADGIYAPMAPILSFLFGAWALSLLFFFFRSLEKDLEAVAKIAGLIGSAIAVLKYDELIDYAVRIAGSGADELAFGLLIAVGILIPAPLFLFWPRKAEPDGVGNAAEGVLAGGEE